MNAPDHPLLTARIALAHVAALSPFRAEASVRSCVQGESLWLRWPGALNALTRRVLATPGAQLFDHGEWGWSAHNSHFPCEVPADDEFRAIADVVSPQQISTESHGDKASYGLPKLTLELVRSTQHEETSAALLSLARLYAWVRATPEVVWQSWRVCWLKQTALVLAPRGKVVKLDVPPQHVQRFWGSRVLLPSGFALSPKLPDALTLALLEAGTGEIALVQKRGVSLVPRASFGAITRAGLRLAIQGGA